MDLLITDLISEDYLQYHALITQAHIQKEFLNFRNQKLVETKDLVLEELAFQRDEAKFKKWDETGLRETSGYVFYNVSK
jgi:hypothetical protein